MVAPSRFRTTRKKVTVRWLTEGEGELVGYALDIVKDAFEERLFRGLLARFPYNAPDGTTAPPDALAAMGRDRRVVRGINESDADFAARLIKWLDDRKTAGNPWTLMRRLSEYLGAGPAFRTVDASGNWFSRDADGVESVLLNQDNWDWDGDTTGRWSRFWVIIYPNGLWTTTVDDWGDVDLDWAEADHVWGCTATPEQVQTVRSLVNDWKPGGTVCVNIIIAPVTSSFDPTAPEPDGLWARWSKTVDGVRVPSRLNTARYWSGA